MGAVGVIMYLLARKFKQCGIEESSGAVISSLFSSLTKVGKFSLFLVLLLGVPRLIFFKELEWSEAKIKGITSVLLFKHTLFFITVLAGIYLWLKAKRSLTESEIDEKT